MAAVAKYRNDQAGTLTTGGSSTAYTLTSNQVFASLSAMNGMALRVKFNATNGASPTLNVDGLGAKAIVTIVGTAVPTSAILANSVHDLVYDNGNSVWVLIGAPYAALGIITGTVMLFRQTAAPSGWTKLTDHNDKALRIVSGSVTSGGSTAFSSVFASRTITQGNLPDVGFNVVIEAGQGSHTHTASTNVAMYTSVTGFAAGSGDITTSAGGTQVTITNNNATLPQMTGTAASGGSGTAMDFAVQYVDVIAAQKD